LDNNDNQDLPNMDGNFSGARAGYSFASGGRTIGVDWFPAAASEPRAAVLMLHGRDGPSRFNAGYQAAARRLASAGYHALFVRYFESTRSTEVMGPEGLANFFAWMRAVGDGLSWVAQQPEIDASRLALLGVSLGAAVALAQAGQDRRVKAVVDFYGGLPAPAFAFLGRLPPTLVLHGGNDWLVPVTAAHQIEAFLKAHGTPHEVKIYPDEGHGFHGAAAEDSVRRTIAFLDRHLGEDAVRAAR
jgi:carboxymethylenebutenolidase